MTERASRPRDRKLVEVVLQNTASYPEIPAAVLRRWLRELVAVLAPDASSVGVRFVGDRAMRRINREYREKDSTTDVLSFPGEETAEGRHLGDVVLCVAQARRQGTEVGHGLVRELRLLLLHGVLHCMGFDHESDKGEMQQLEGQLRRRWIE